VPGIRPIQRVLALAKKHGVAVLEKAATAALEIGVPTYRFLRKYVDRRPVPLTLRQVDPLIRQLTLYRYLIDRKTQNRRRTMNLVELDHGLRKPRLSGIAAVLETRLRHAQTDRLTPIDLVSTIVSDELLERRHTQARFREPDRSVDSFDSEFNKKMNRALIHDLPTARFIAQRETRCSWAPGTGSAISRKLSAAQ
jgi:hypothetical protein